MLLTTSLVLLSLKSVNGDEVKRISNANDFSYFVNDVNSGVSDYSGTTVYLDSDLSLPEIIEPIGINSTYQFRGVFDGQGHIINSLTIDSSSLEYMGLFGYSTGLTIRNVVLDSSCSMEYSHTGTFVSIGSILGYCYASNKDCSIKNSVNMADVTFSGEISDNSYNFYLGGVSGYLKSSLYNAYVKNCANYGSVTDSGTSGYSWIGGISGELFGDYSTYVYVYNCINYGTITHDGTTSSTLTIGGIAGWSYYGYVENCVSAGEIISMQTTSFIGSIIGDSTSESSIINNCHYTSDVNVDSLYGGGPTTSPESVDPALIESLNTYASSGEWNRWILNTNNEYVSFIINKGNAFAVNSQIILLPNPVDDNVLTFSGWYIDENLSLLFTADEVETRTFLYGMFCGLPNYTVTLDTNGGEELDENENKVATVCNIFYGTLPETVTKSGYAFAGWFTEKEGGNEIVSGDKVTNLNDHTLYAHWEVNNYTVRFIFDNGAEDDVRVLEYNTTFVYPTDPEKEGHTFSSWDINITNMPGYNLNITAQWSINNYTVTFDVNGGNELADNKMTVAFNERYGNLPEATRDEHMFVGWFTERVDGTKVTNETIFNITTNITLYAHWEKITSQVEIVFNTKDMSKKDIEEIVKGYVEEGTKFTIVEIESDDSDEKRVVIKFVNAGQAEEFVRNVNELGKDGGNKSIKRISFASYNGGGSLSAMFYPMHLLLVII